MLCPSSVQSGIENRFALAEGRLLFYEDDSSRPHRDGRDNRLGFVARLIFGRRFEVNRELCSISYLSRSLDSASQPVFAIRTEPFDAVD
jgi:hypothetical protein